MVKTISENALDVLKTLEFFMMFRTCLLPHYYIPWFIIWMINSDVINRWKGTDYENHVES